MVGNNVFLEFILNDLMMFDFCDGIMIKVFRI